MKAANYSKYAGSECQSNFIGISKYVTRKSAFDKNVGLPSDAKCDMMILCKNEVRSWFKKNSRWPKSGCYRRNIVNLMPNNVKYQRKNEKAQTSVFLH